MTPRDLDGRDGGPAFPTDAPMVFVRTATESGKDALEEAVRESRRDFDYTGISLRDYFAARDMATHPPAANGIVGKIVGWLWYGPAISYEEAAEDAYDMADAMLAEREK